MKEKSAKNGKIWLEEKEKSEIRLKNVGKKIKLQKERDKEGMKETEEE